MDGAGKIIKSIGVMAMRPRRFNSTDPAEIVDVYSRLVFLFLPWPRIYLDLRTGTYRIACMKKFLCMALVSLAVVAAGCESARLVVPPGSAETTPGAPMNEKDRPGIIKYLSEGSDSAVKRRREEAYAKMSELCASCYEIVSEGPSQTVQAVHSDTYIFGRNWIVNYPGYYTQEYVYIKFRCVPCPAR
ncbi:MAG: hypothetical protein MUD12_11075 [Spirochaetes bacterium]|jgi:hypothetical protein|nr:hypothetical protein [Spirochaetota bacterium]